MSVTIEDADIHGTVTVVIPAYNRLDRMPRVLAPLLDDPATAEVIVVADGCIDGTVEYLQALAATDPRVRPVIHETSVGGQDSRRAGAAAASQAVVLMIDDDVVCERGTVGRHARAHRDADRPGAVIGTMPLVESEEARRPAGTVLYDDEYHATTQRWLADHTTMFSLYWGGHTSFPTSTFLSIEMPDLPTDMYHADQVFGLLLGRAGVHARFDPTIRAVHLHTRTVPQLVRQWRTQGRDQVLVADLFPGEVAPADPGWTVTNVPAPLAVIIRATDRPVAFRAAVTILSRALELLDRTGPAGAAMATARLLRRIVWRDAMRRALTGPRREPLSAEPIEERLA